MAEGFGRERYVPNQGEDESEPTSWAGEEPPYEVGATMRTSTGRDVRLMRYQKEKGLYEVMEFGPNAPSSAWRVSPDNLKPIEDRETPA